MEGREIVKELSLNEYSSDHDAQKDDQHNEDHAYNTTLYKEFKYDGHHWAMAIDLNSCTGCSNCVLSCQAENNIPIVGKEEVSRVHEMHWLRIDRYYTGDENNPKVVFQPMMCQHCDNAPCENVCPVLATTHSSEGLNQMTYNRCVGTRYCANNCPYKVRRFNWFDYTNVDAMKDNLHDPLGMTSDLKRMVLNPDVTVRAKGVIEKCSFCSQRIQEKKLLAKLENRPLDDGEIVPACAQSCPGNAIVFGDLNDKTSEVAQLFKNNRKSRVLEEIHTEPSIGYLTKISNNGKTNIV
jgi:molybdopterin-containing oxidoreductase family iron-sulfur binding subunit